MTGKGIAALHLSLTLGLGMIALLSPAFARDGARIVTLGGSVTEIAVALGAQARLVARDSTSTFPPFVQDLPDLGYIRALSAEGVLSVAPDVILAEDGAGPPEAIEVLRTAGVPFVTIPNDPSPEGVLAKIAAVAAELGEEQAGAKLQADIAAKLQDARTRAAGVSHKKRVLFILSLQGGRVMAGGANSSAQGIIDLAGGVNAATGFDGYKQMTDEAVIASAPDMILLMDREGDLAVADSDVQAHPALGKTPAAQSGAILRMDGMLLLGFGPRTPDAAKALFAALYPEAG